MGKAYTSKGILSKIFMRHHLSQAGAAVIFLAILLIVPFTFDGSPPSEPLPVSETRGASSRLAYIGADGNIYVTTPDFSEKLAITDDATTSPEGPGLSYPRVAWSPDGKLAYASVIRSGNDAQARLYIQEDLAAEPRLVGQSDKHFVIYIYWSPAACTFDQDCSELTYLIEEPDGIGLRLVRSSPTGTTNRLLGLGWPFYYSWSSDGEVMLWHTGGAYRFSDDARLTHYSLRKDEASVTGFQPGLFIAPAWSPSGEEWLAVTELEGKDTLQWISSQSEKQTLENLHQASDKHIVFSWSPDGSRIAYSVLRRSGGLIFGPVHIYDSSSGKTYQATSSSFDISGFFWSPDGTRLAYLSRLPLRESVWMQWRVVDTATGQDRGYAAFNPSYQMRYVISSFNQYAQSHRLWSPDGRYLVYADQDDQRIERVWVVDTYAERGADPILVDEGTIGFWSWK
jgi:TolB protein